MSAGQYIKLTGSVGKNGVNHPDDVMKIQTRLNNWIYRGLLPEIELLAMDGKCGDKSKQAIGAFQYLYLGHIHPDCRVDPGGKTLLRLYDSLIDPQRIISDYIDYIRDRFNEQFGPKPKVKNWTVSPDEERKIRSAWGSELADWAKIPPVEGEAEAKEFTPPSFLRDKYETVFAWKCGSPQLNCGACPRDRLQVLAMVRSDQAFWANKMGDNRIGIEMMKTSSATAIRDYRDFIVRKKYCPPTAKLRLEQISKDTIYQMFIGMYQMMSPVGVPTAYANQSGAVAGAVKAIIAWYNDPEKNSGKKPIWSYF